MPPRQKLLLIVLVLALGYAIYTFVLKRGNSQMPGGDIAASPQLQNTQPQAVVSQQVSPLSGSIQQSNIQPRPPQKRFEYSIGADPFARPIKQKAVAEALPLDSPVAQLKLTGTGFGKVLGKYAIINNQIYKLGEEVNNLKIIEIGGDYIILRSPAGSRYTLKIGGLYE